MTTITNDISAELNLIARRGDTYQREFIVKNADDSSYNFTSYSAKMHIKAKKDDTAKILELDSGVGGEITLSTGSIVILIPAATMKNILPKNYYYDLEITYPDASIKTWLYGRFTVNQDVTR